MSAIAKDPIFLPSCALVEGHRRGTHGWAVLAVAALNWAALAIAALAFVAAGAAVWLNWV
jgi:hypothetical protein